MQSEGLSLDSRDRRVFDVGETPFGSRWYEILQAVVAVTARPSSSARKGAYPVDPLDAFHLKLRHACDVRGYRWPAIRVAVRQKLRQATSSNPVGAAIRAQGALSAPAARWSHFALPAEGSGRCVGHIQGRKQPNHSTTTCTTALLPWPAARRMASGTLPTCRS